MLPRNSAFLKSGCARGFEVECVFATVNVFQRPNVILTDNPGNSLSTVVYRNAATVFPGVEHVFAHVLGKL